LKVSYHDHSYYGASELNPTLAHTFFPQSLSFVRRRATALGQ
jgi:hypothetical protein